MASFETPTQNYGRLKSHIKLLREGLDENDINKITKVFDSHQDPYFRSRYHSLLRQIQHRNPDISPIDDPSFRSYIEYLITDKEAFINTYLPPNVKAEYSREKSALASSLPKLPSEIKETIGSYSHAGGKRRKTRKMRGGIFGSTLKSSFTPKYATFEGLKQYLDYLLSRHIAGNIFERKTKGSINYYQYQNIDDKYALLRFRVLFEKCSEVVDLQSDMFKFCPPKEDSLYNKDCQTKKDYPSEFINAYNSIIGLVYNPAIDAIAKQPNSPDYVKVVQDYNTSVTVLKYATNGILNNLNLQQQKDLIFKLNQPFDCSRGLNPPQPPRIFPAFECFIESKAPFMNQPMPPLQPVPLQQMMPPQQPQQQMMSPQQPPQQQMMYPQQQMMLPQQQPQQSSFLGVFGGKRRIRRRRTNKRGKKSKMRITSL